MGRRIKQERRDQGKTAPQTTRSRRKVWEPHAEWILAKLAASPTSISASQNGQKIAQQQLKTQQQIRDELKGIRQNAVQFVPMGLG